MSNNEANTALSNPFSTGGGGVTFEQLVGTSYLVSLLESIIGEYNRDRHPFSWIINILLLN